jgi:hypothetical protein
MDAQEDRILSSLVNSGLSRPTHLRIQQELRAARAVPESLQITRNQIVTIVFAYIELDLCSFL